MRHDDEGESLLLAQPEEELEELTLTDAVEGAGRLICQHDLGVIDDRSRHGDPLLLPARQLRRAVVQPITEGETAKELARLSHRLTAALTADHRRDGDILHSSKLGHQLVGLEDEAEVTIAEGGTPIAR